MTKRREFMGYMGASALGLMLPRMVLADDKQKSGSRSGSAIPKPAPVPGPTGAAGRVVVVGGGMAGATVAKYLRIWGGSGVEVTLVEREKNYRSCILSNLVLNGSMTMDDLTFSWGALPQYYGVRIVAGDVLAIDPGGKSIDVSTSSGRTRLSYDRLVLAPGVEFDTIPGLETAAAQALVPHAWKAGEQTTILRDQIRAMPSGGVYAMTIPLAPYRCPPGPYERACVVADFLKRNNPRAKLLIFDANPGIVAEKQNFGQAFSVLYKGIVEYYPSATLLGIDAATRTLKTSYGDYRCAVINAIPPHRAGRIITDSSLANVNGRWAGVNVLSYESSVARGVHIIGDSSGTTQPKAGHIANQEAKVCADAITRLLRGQTLDPAPVTNSACYSPITANTASWLTAVFAYDAGTGTMKPVAASSGEAAGPTRDNFEEMFVWFNNLMADSFA